MYESYSFNYRSLYKMKFVIVIKKNYLTGRHITYYNIKYGLIFLIYYS